jgi:hypothetical protein
MATRAAALKSKRFEVVTQPPATDEAARRESNLEAQTSEAALEDVESEVEQRSLEAQESAAASEQIGEEVGAEQGGGGGKRKRKKKKEEPSKPPTTVMEAALAAFEEEQRMLQKVSCLILCPRWLLAR